MSSILGSARLRSSVGKLALCWQRWRRPRAWTVLTYHDLRSPEVPGGPLEFGESIHRFEQQLAYLKAHYNPIRLSQLLDHLREGAPLPERAVLLTFDDGFRSIMAHGLPLMVRHGFPSVWFVLPGSLGGENPYFGEVLRQACLHPPASRLQFEGASYSLETPEDRWRTFRQVMDRCIELPAERRNGLLSEAIRAGPASENELRERACGQLLRARDLESLPREWVDLGSHTLDHPNLAVESDEVVEKQLAESRSRLEAAWGAPVRSLAYPYGEGAHVTDRVFAIARKHYEIAFTQIRPRPGARVDPLAAGRHGVSPRDDFFLSLSGLLHHPVLLRLAGVKTAAAGPRSS